MTPHERDAILRLTDEHTFRRGLSVLREGETTALGLWMLQNGKCEVVKMLEHDGEQRLATLSPGAIFGELSFFDPSPHSATIRAIEEVEITFLSIEKFETLRESNEVAAEKLLINMGRMMAKKLRHMDHYTLDLFAVAPVATMN